MKHLFLGLLLMPVLISAQSSFNMTLLSNLDLPDLPSRFGAEYNDCWGFKHSNGTEIAIIGGMEDIFFVNVTSPANPVVIYTHHVENINGTTNASLWRDFKTYQNYAYAAADEGDSGLLIFDLSNVPTSVTLVTQTNAFWNRTHNIYIDEANGRLYAAGSNTQSTGLKILDLVASPSNPPQIGNISLSSLGGGYVHDVHVKNNIAYCSHGSLHKLQIYDMSNLANITVVGTIDEYPEEGYNHSSWVNTETNMLVMADETHGSDLKLIDISDPANVSADDISTFYSELEGPSAPGASVAHNPFIEGDLAYIAYYHDGVQVFDISDPDDIELLAYYDTYVNTEYSSYDGCWGVYPYLPSGIIIASDQNNGLFVMEITDDALGIEFLSFEARRSSEDVVLQWAITDAAFGNRFEVKRSADGGVTFETIGTVNLIDGKYVYAFTDKNAAGSFQYIYRIDFVEYDGNRIDSPVRVISGGSASDFIRVINPVSSSLILDILKPIEELTLHLYAMDGRLIWSVEDKDPKARIEINSAELIPGQYVLGMAWPGGEENLMIQVVK